MVRKSLLVYIIASHLSVLCALRGERLPGGCSVAIWAIGMASKMSDWLPFAILALLMWGLWGFFPKLATNHIHPNSVLIYQVIGASIIGVIILAFAGFKPEIHAKGILFGVLTGVTGTLGALFFLFAINKGKASVIVTMTSLYPLITILLAFVLLKEPITIKQAIGMLFALMAMILFSI